MIVKDDIINADNGGGSEGFGVTALGEAAAAHFVMACIAITYRYKAYLVTAFGPQGGSTSCSKFTIVWVGTNN
jgi:hypothetical protein